MNTAFRLVAATMLLLASVIPGYFAFFTKWAHSDFQAYAIGSVSLILAAASFAFLYPERKRIGFRFYATLAGLFTAFWAIEVFGGLALYLADKIARHYQRS